MKNLSKILGVVAIVLVANTANAQLGKLKKMAKNKVGKGTTTVDGKNSGSAKEKEPLDLDLTTFPMKPAITMSSLMYGTKVHQGGGTSLSSYTASFVPYKKKDGTPVSPISDQGEYLKVKVYKGDVFLDYFEYDGGTTFDNNKLRKFNEPTSRYMKNGDWASGSNIDLKKHGEGTYRMEFYAGSLLFYNFEFEVYKVTSDDPYASLNEMWLSKGPWNKYAWFEHQKSGNMIFGFYLNHEEFQPNAADPNKTTKDVSWTVLIKKDGKDFATHYNGLSKPKKSKVERAEWTKLSTAMKLMDAKTPVMKETFTDGNYTIELKIDNEDKPRIYEFSVAGGKIVYMDKQDRKKNTDPTRLVEGWNNFWYFEKK